MCNCLCIEVPNANISIRPGNKVKLGKFESELWKVCYGWYAWGGNRPVCGWYLVSENNGNIKPLQKPDLDDIYIIEC